MIDCIGVHDEKTCRILDVRKCDPGKCSFKKTIAAHQASINRANARLRSLPLDQQVYIADKYHRGRKPWNGEVL